MANTSVSKPSKWLSNIGLNISILRPRSKSSSSVSPPSSPMSPCPVPKDSRDYLDEFKEVFRYFDSNGDGKISASELREYFGSIKEYMSHEDAQGVIDELDSDGDSLLDFEDFVKLMKRGGGGEINNDDNCADEDDLRKAFEMFEMEKGSGCITPKGLQRMLKRLGDEKSYDECVAMIGFFDIDGNGVLDFHEFHQMMI